MKLSKERETKNSKPKNEQVIDKVPQQEISVKSTDTNLLPAEPIEKKKEGAFCGICNETVRSFKRHAAVHTTLDDNKLYKCNYCVETLTDISSLETHLTTHIEYDTPRHCPDCNFSIKSRAGYQEHVRKHRENTVGENQRIYICEFCDSCYTCHKSFKIHVLVKHHGEIQIHLIPCLNKKKTK